MRAVTDFQYAFQRSEETGQEVAHGDFKITIYFYLTVTLNNGQVSAFLPGESGEKKPPRRPPGLSVSVERPTGGSITVAGITGVWRD